MKKKFFFLLGVLLPALALCSVLFLSYESKKLCDQLREIHLREGDSMSSTFPLRYYERFFCQMARDHDNPRAKYALNLLGEMRSVRGRPIIEGYLTSKDSLFRAVAADTVASYSDKKAFNSLIDLLEEEKDLRVNAIAGSRLADLIHIVDISQLEAFLENAESAEQKYIAAGLVFFKTEDDENYKVFQERRSRLPAKSLPLIKYFEQRRGQPMEKVPVL